jgi:Mn2+/Fe2+ NRAMP family transporter
MEEKKTTFLKKITLALSAIGPGLFLIGYNIGTGSITTLSSAGSHYGMSLFWVLVLSVVFVYVLLVAYGQFTLVTGETAMRGYRKFLPAGNVIAIFMIFSLALGEFVGIAGIMGVVSELIKDWTAMLFGGHGLNMLLTTAVIIAGSYYLFWTGHYSKFEKFLISLVIIMGISFLLSLFMMVPDTSDIVKGLVPRVPEEKNALLIIASIAGTTCGAIVFIMRSVVVAEKGWTIRNLSQAKRDAFWSAFFMLLLSGTIMALAAGTLYKMGKPVDRAIDMVKILEPFAGRFAVSIFVVGVISAAVSTIFPIALILPWLLSDYRGKKRDIQSPLYRILGAVAFLLAFTIPVFGGRPVWVLVFAGAIQSVMLPVATITIFFLINNKKIMGKHTAGLWLNIGILASILFSLYTTYAGVVGIIGDLTD